MDTAIKKRLVGALVLGVLLLLSLPVLFSGQGRLPEPRITDIPPAPVVATAPAIQSERDESLAQPDTIDQILEPEPAEVEETEPSAEPVTEPDGDELPYQRDETGQIEAWSIQMGSFSQAGNARRLLEALREEGYDAYTRETPLPDGGKLTQVLAGPYTSQDEARAERSYLSDTFDVSTLIVRFQP